ncbi:hypothetical protein Tco_1486456 [Tanacetum coccineum]
MLYNFTSLPNVNSSTPIPTTIQPTTLEQVDNVEDAALLVLAGLCFAIKKEETERKFILLADPSWNS